MYSLDFFVIGKRKLQVNSNFDLMILPGSKLLM